MWPFVSVGLSMDSMFLSWSLSVMESPDIKKPARQYGFGGIDLPLAIRSMTCSAHPCKLMRADLALGYAHGRLGIQLRADRAKVNLDVGDCDARHDVSGCR